MSNSKHAKEFASHLIAKMGGNHVVTIPAGEFDKMAEQFHFFGLTDKLYLRNNTAELVEAALLRAGYVIAAGNKVIVIAADSNFFRVPVGDSHA